MIRPATINDAAAIAAIYNHYVERTVITFDEEIIGLEEMAERIREIQTDNLPWFVWDESGQIYGYAYAGKWKSRCSYRYSLEASVYLNHEVVRRGLGTKLYSSVVSAVREKQYHALIGGISLPNPASVALHEKLGFTKVAHFKEVGHKFDQWIDVGYWQLIL